MANDARRVHGVLERAVHWIEAHRPEVQVVEWEMAVVWVQVRPGQSIEGAADGQVSEKAHFGRSHLPRMAPIVEGDGAADAVDVSLCGADGVAFES